MTSRRPPARKPKSGQFRLNPIPPPVDVLNPVFSKAVFPGPDEKTLAVFEYLEHLRRRDGWIGMADRVLAGEFDHRDIPTSTLQTLFFGFRKSCQPECVAAVERIRGHRNFSNVREFVFREDPKRRK